MIRNYQCHWYIKTTIWDLDIRKEDTRRPSASYLAFECITADARWYIATTIYGILYPRWRYPTSFGLGGAVKRLEPRDSLGTNMKAPRLSDNNCSLPVRWFSASLLALNVSMQLMHLGMIEEQRSRVREASEGMHIYCLLEEKCRLREHHKTRKHHAFLAKETYLNVSILIKHLKGHLRPCTNALMRLKSRKRRRNQIPIPRLTNTSDWPIKHHKDPPPYACHHRPPIHPILGVQSPSRDDYSHLRANPTHHPLVDVLGIKAVDELHTTFHGSQW